MRMSVDKAVSTEDLCAVEEATLTAAGVLRLEAFFNTLVECKVESLKNENNGKISSLHSSPRSILQRLKSASPKPTLRIEREKKKDAKTKRKERMRARRVVSERRQFKRQVLRQETSVSVSSPESQSVHQFKRHYEGSSISDDEIRQQRCSGLGHIDNPCGHHNWHSCHSLPETICYCHHERPMSQYIDADCISLKIDGYADESDVIFEQEELRRQKRKRRRRRKKKMKKRLGAYPHLVEPVFDQESFKHLNDDELPPRAKWTIVATACLLLFMCLLLVGITLRMAPLIDEIVREENEKLINSISQAGNISLQSVHNNIR